MIEFIFNGIIGIYKTTQNFYTTQDYKNDLETFSIIPNELYNSSP